MCRMRNLLPVAAVLIACSDPQPPVSCAKLPRISVFVGETATAKPCFSDPDGGALSLTAVSGNAEIATVTLVEEELRVTGVRPGATEVTVTATDADGMIGTADVAVVVPNRSPTGQLDDIEVRRGVARTIDLAAHFSDPDGQALTYTASSSAPAAVSAEVSGATLTVTPVAREGSAEITVVASDGEMNATVAFETVIIYPAGVTISPEAAELDYLQTVVLTGIVVDQNGNEMPEEAVEWSSEDADVATVSGEGLVTGRGVGVTRILATADEATGSAAITGVLRERGALARIYESLNGDGWTNNENWLTAEPLGSWHGVSLNADGNVRFLRLAGNNLAGAIPSEVGVLDRIWDLDMSNNRIEGSIPAEIGQLASLQVLALTNNQLTGSIPAEIGNTDLRSLEIQQNNLTGPIPSSIGDLDELSILGVDSNDLSGPLPRSMINLSLFFFSWTNNTELCSPPDDEFQAWLGSIVVHLGGGTCSQ